MKKMMIAVCAVALAAVAQAASVDWKVSLAGGSTGRVWDSTGNTVWTVTSSGNSNQVAYFMLSTMADTFVDALSNKGSLEGLYIDKNTSFTAASGITSQKAAVSDLITIDSQTFVTVLVYDDANGDTFYKVSSEVASDARAQATDPALVTFASNTAINPQSWTKVGGSAIPEPTSALMLLVGLTGLALRRKLA